MVTRKYTGTVDDPDGVVNVACNLSPADTAAESPVTSTVIGVLTPLDRARKTRATEVAAALAKESTAWAKPKEKRPLAPGRLIRRAQTKSLPRPNRHQNSGSQIELPIPPDVQARSYRKTIHTLAR